MSKVVQAPVSYPVPDGVKLSPAPTEKGAAGAVKWYAETLEFPMTVNYLKRKTEDRTLPSFFIGGAIWYSTRDLYELLIRTRRDGAAS
ncbi:hypothetical protein BH10ACT9_BH10ACT9_36500 [soil metagenome]